MLLFAYTAVCLRGDFGMIDICYNYKLANLENQLIILTANWLLNLSPYLILIEK